MGVFADLMKQLDIVVASPDGQIRLRRYDRQLSMAFSGESYYRYKKNELCRQLEGLCQLMWVSHRRETLRVASIARGYETTGRDFPDDPVYRAFYKERENIEAIGLGNNDLIDIWNCGWTKWEVNIEDGVLEDLDHQGFVAEFISAAEDMLGDYRLKLKEINERHFPPPHRDLIKSS